jgi:hypothetical protein
MLGFAPLSTYPFSAFPSLSTSSGVFGTGVVGSVTVLIGKSVTVTGVAGIGRVGTVGAGQGQTVTVSGVRGTGVIDHVCLRTWNEVDTVAC